MSKLPAERDISLLHVLPKGFHRIIQRINKIN
jgi:hypothetical protein